MPATTIRDLLVRLGVDADTAGLKDFDNGLKSVVVGLTAVTVAAAGAIVGLFGITASTAAAGDAAAKTAAQIGLTTAAYQELLFAAERSGASQEQLAVGLKTVQRLAFDAANGNVEAAKAFERLGISVTDANGELKDGETLLLEAADAISKLDNEAEKIALAQKLFGEGGAALIPLLNEGAAGIDELRRRARELGFVMDEEASRASEKFSDSLLDSNKALEGLKNQIGIAFLPVFTRLLDGFTAAVVFLQPLARGFLAFIDNTIGLEGVLAGLVAIVIAFGSAAAALTAILGIGALAGAVTAIIGFFTTFAAIIGTALAPAVGLFVAGVVALAGSLAFLAVQIASVLAFFAGMLLVVEDFIVFMRGGKSVVGEFVQSFIDSEGPLGQFAELLLALKTLGLSLFDLFGAFAELVVAVLVPAFDLAVTALTPVLTLVVGLLAALAELAAVQLGEFAGNVTSVLDRVTQAVSFVTGAVSDLVNLLTGAASLAGSLGIIDAGALGSSTNNTTTNNVAINTNAPITTTGDAGETAGAVAGSVGGAAAEALAALTGGEA